MAVDLLLAVADDGLRAVLEIALTADGCTVRTAGTEAEALAALVASPPEVLLFDAALPTAPDPFAWAARHAPAIPLLLLVSAVDGWPTPTRPDAMLLEMPFGREALRHAVTIAGRAAAINRVRRVPGSAGRAGGE